jgi:hypothetical protein
LNLLHIARQPYYLTIEACKRWRSTKREKRGTTTIV